MQAFLSYLPLRTDIRLGVSQLLWLDKIDQISFDFFPLWSLRSDIKMSDHAGSTAPCLGSWRVSGSRTGVGLIRTRDLRCFVALATQESEKQLLREWPMHTSVDIDSEQVFRSVVIDDLLQDLENAFVVFIYCDYRDQALQTSAHLLGSLLAQVVKRSAKLPDGLKSAYEVNRHSSSSFDTQQATQFLTAICKQLKRTYCCIDALDELGNDARVQLLQSLQLVCHECPGFRICFTGRPSIEAKVVQFLGQSTSIYQARIKAGDEDVKRFIIDKLDGEPDELLMNDSLKMSIVKTLVNLSNGMLVVYFLC